MTLPSAPHQSSSDWLFDGQCIIDPTHFITPPFALANQALQYCYASLIHPYARNIPQGRITTSWYVKTETQVGIFFCLQDPLERIFQSASYATVFIPGWPTYLWFFSPDGDILLGTWPFNITPNIWQTVRITWTRTCSFDARTILQIRLEVLAGPNPGDYDIIEVTPDPFHSSLTNGVALWIRVFDQAWTDDFLLEQFS